MGLDAGKHDSSGMSGSDISNLVNLFTNKNSSGTSSSNSATQNSGAVTNTGSTTTSTSMSPDAMSAMLKTILEQTNGLASTALGEHTAGLYNSSTNQLLTNDLLTRAAAQVAQNTKSQTVTQNTAQTDNRGSVTSNNGATTNKTAAPIAPGTAAKGAATIAGVNLVSKFLPQGLGSSIADRIKGAFSSGPDTSSDNIDAGGGWSPATVTQTDAPTVSDAGSAGDSTAVGYDPGAIDTSAATDAGSGTADVASGMLDNVDGVSGVDTSSVSDAVDGVDWGSIFAADGGLIDPNRPDGDKPPSNLSFAQQNPIVISIQRGLQPRSSAAGYAEGGNVFQRRTASIDAQTDAAVNGSPQPTQAPAPQQAASAPAPAQYQSKPHPVIDAIMKTIHSFAGGGQVHAMYDDGGKVDLTNLGLTIQSPSSTSRGTSLSALNTPTDASKNTVSVHGPDDHGTGFANTSNQALTTAVTPVESPAPKSTTPSTSTRRANTTRVDSTSSSSTTESGQAVGGIDSNPSAVSNAALSLGLSGFAPVLGPLAPALSLGLALSHAISAVSAASGTSGSTDSGTTATADADSAATAATGSVSVGSMSVGNDSMDANAIGTIGAISDTEGVNGDTPGIGNANGIGDGNSTADSSATGDAGDSGTSLAKGGNVVGPGEDDSDSVPANLSNGEFVVNAAAAAHFRPWLEMINNAVRAK